MKILIIVPAYPNKKQIAYQFVHERVKEYQKQFEISVFCLKNTFISPYTYENVSVNGGSKTKLLEFIKNNNFDIFAFHYLNISSARFIKKYLLNKKVFIWFHGSDCVDCRRRFHKLKNASFRKKIENIIKQTLIYWANVVKIHTIKYINKKAKNCIFVFISNWSHKTSEKDFKIKYKKYRIIPNYINSDYYKYKQKKEADRLKVLSIKSFASYVYGNDILQDVILEFSKYKEFKEFEFNIYGDGVLFDECTNKLKQFKNVNINQGFLSHGEILKIQNKNGIFIYPKRGDSQGVSRCEAMASGLVPIASNVEAIPEFVPSNTGYLVNTVEDFINTLLFVYYNPKDFLKKSDQASKYIKEKFSYENTIQKEIELFMEE